MHIGVARAGPDTAGRLLRLEDGRIDGAISADGRVAGTYVHGLFADDRQRARLDRAAWGDACRLQL